MNKTNPDSIAHDPRLVAKYHAASEAYDAAVEAGHDSEHLYQAEAEALAAMQDEREERLGYKKRIPFPEPPKPERGVSAAVDAAMDAVAVAQVAADKATATWHAHRCKPSVDHPDNQVLASRLMFEPEFIQRDIELAGIMQDADERLEAAEDAVYDAWAEHTGEPRPVFVEDCD